MKRINHIEIVEEIGSGGTSSIYKGVDLNTGHLVAVKVLWSNLFKNEAMRKQFVFEANQYLYLDHPNIVKLKDFITTEDNYYLITEFIDGINLEEHINKVSGPIPEPIAIRMITEVLSAIGYAHQKNVLHLDIKPSNIMITEEGHIRILDFGISHESSSVSNSTIMGSPLYMSPEQTEANGIDARSDIYAIGITLFQMLTARTPLRGNMSRDELFVKIRKGELPKAKAYYPFVSDQMQHVLDSATATSKERRFASAGHFINALKTIVN